MDAGKFTDSGYRFRENSIDKHDTIMPFVTGGTEHFHDVFLFNSDTLHVGEDYMSIAEMYFRLSVDKVEHTRIVYKFMDWLGALGGVGDIMMMMITFLIGGYA